MIDLQNAVADGQTSQEYIRDETHNLRRELLRAQEEVKRIQSVPLVIGQFLEPVDERRGIVGSTTGMWQIIVKSRCLLGLLGLTGEHI
jgi:ATP-dependent 26S proteasome regulatory subunit